MNFIHADIRRETQNTKKQIRSLISEEFPDMSYTIMFDHDSRRSGTFNPPYDQAVVIYNISLDGQRNFKENKVRAIIKNYFSNNQDALSHKIKNIKKVSFRLGKDLSTEKPNQTFVDNVVQVFNDNEKVDGPSFLESLRILATASNTTKDIINYNAIIAKLSEQS